MQATPLSFFCVKHSCFLTGLLVSVVVFCKSNFNLMPIFRVSKSHLSIGTRMKSRPAQSVLFWRQRIVCRFGAMNRPHYSMGENARKLVFQLCKHLISCRGNPLWNRIWSGNIKNSSELSSSRNSLQASVFHDPNFQISVILNPL